MPPSPESERATGRPVQALPNTLIVKRLADSVRILPSWRPNQFHPVRRDCPPSFERAFQSTTVGPSRQPPSSNFFFDFVRGLPPPNSFNLNHLAFTGQGANPSVSPPRPPAASVWAAAFKDTVPEAARQPPVARSLPFRFLRGANDTPSRCTRQPLRGPSRPVERTFG